MQIVIEDGEMLKQVLGINIPRKGVQGDDEMLKRVQNDRKNQKRL